MPPDLRPAPAACSHWRALLAVVWDTCARRVLWPVHRRSARQGTDCLWTACALAPVCGLPVHSPLAVCSDTAVCLDAQTACAHASPRSHETMRRVGAGCVASAADARVVRSMFAAGGADPLLSFCPVACYPRVRTVAGGGVFQVRGPAHGLRSAAGGGSGRGQ